MVEGEIEAGRIYKEADFNRIMNQEPREEARQILMGMIDQREKTLVFVPTRPMRWLMTINWNPKRARIPALSSRHGR